MYTCLSHSSFPKTKLTKNGWSIIPIFPPKNMLRFIHLFYHFLFSYSLLFASIFIFFFLSAFLKLVFSFLLELLASFKFFLFTNKIKNNKTYSLKMIFSLSIAFFVSHMFWYVVFHDYYYFLDTLQFLPEFPLWLKSY